MVAERFEALLTADLNIEFQWNLKGLGIGVAVVHAHTNRMKELRPLVPQILDALSKVTPGAIIRVADRQ